MASLPAFARAVRGQARRSAPAKAGGKRIHCLKQKLGREFLRSKTGAFFMAARREPSRGAAAKSFSIPALPVIRKFSPIQVTRARLSA
jgi:hypothetical protein